MPSLLDTFPLLARQLSQKLREQLHAALADDIEQIAVDRVTFDEGANAGYIYVRPSRPLNAVDANIVGVRHGRTIEVDTHYWTAIDVDNFERLMGVEVLAPGDLKHDLMEHAKA